MTAVGVFNTLIVNAFVVNALGSMRALVDSIHWSRVCNKIAPSLVRGRVPSKAGHELVYPPITDRPLLTEKQGHFFNCRSPNAPGRISSRLLMRIRLPLRHGLHHARQPG